MACSQTSRHGIRLPESCQPPGVLPTYVTESVFGRLEDDFCNGIEPRPADLDWECHGNLTVIKIQIRTLCAAGRLN